MIKVLRTWKRDGTQNEMTLKAAQESLSRTLANGDKKNIVVRLLAGETLETEYARFNLSGADTPLIAEG